MTKKRVVKKKECNICKRNLAYSNFYKVIDNFLFPDGHLNTCVKCVKEKIENDPSPLDKFIILLQVVDKPFLKILWNDDDGDIGVYMRKINSLPQYRGLRFKDGDTSTDMFTQTQTDNFSVSEKLMEKWGHGYSPEEYRSFETKYRILESSYENKTAMHEEALKTYIRYRVKEEMSTARGDVKEAKAWGDLAQKAASDAKINPSQLSKADLSGGLDTFGQVARAVEEAQDIIPILPEFKARPRDDVDFTIWCYINYIRDLKGLPLVEYEDIYQFYEERKKEYEQHYAESEEGEA